VKLDEEEFCEVCSLVCPEKISHVRVYAKYVVVSLEASFFLVLKLFFWGGGDPLDPTPWTALVCQMGSKVFLTTLTACVILVFALSFAFVSMPRPGINLGDLNRDPWSTMEKVETTRFS